MENIYKTKTIKKSSWLFSVILIKSFFNDPPFEFVINIHIFTYTTLKYFIFFTTICIS